MRHTIKITREWVRALAEHPRRGPRDYFLFSSPNQVFSFTDPNTGWSNSRLPQPIPQDMLVAGASALGAKLSDRIGGLLEVDPPLLRIVGPDGRFVCAFDVTTAELDQERLPLLKRLSGEIKNLSRFGGRVADDILPREIINRANRALEILSEPVTRPALKRDLSPGRWAEWNHLRDNDALPGPHESLKTVQPYATSAFLISPRGIRLAVGGDVDARHHLSRLKDLVVGEAVGVESPRIDFCYLVDGRELATGGAEWRVPLRERWLELKPCDHAVSFHGPRIVELIPLEGNVAHVWGSDPVKAI